MSDKRKCCYCGKVAEAEAKEMAYPMLKPNLTMVCRMYGGGKDKIGWIYNCDDVLSCLCRVRFQHDSKSNFKHTDLRPEPKPEPKPKPEPEALPEMENAYWIITQDCQYDAQEPIFKSAVGVRSSNYPDGIVNIPACATKTLPYRFKLLDGDGEVYYRGFCSCDSSFAPLDDYGTPDSGCTEIHYLVDGKWVPL